MKDLPAVLRDSSLRQTSLRMKEKLMSLIKWSPFFVEPFEDSPGVAQGGGGLIPMVDVYEVADAIMIEAPMPGIDPKNIELAIDQGMLSIKATNERKTEIEEKNYYRKEVRHGTVYRQIALPSPVQEDAAEANYENGVLKIKLPKRSPTSRAIKVEVK